MDDTHKFPVLQGHPEEDKAKELRKGIISTVYNEAFEMGCDRGEEGAAKEVDEFIAAVEAAQRARLLQTLLNARNAEESESMRLEREAILLKVRGAFFLAEDKERQATRHSVLAQGITTAGAALGYTWAELHPFWAG
jgi:hypothetical protein